MSRINLWLKTSKASKLLYFHCCPWTKLVDWDRVKCPKKIKIKLEKKCINCCEDKSLVVKIDFIIFLSYFIEKVFLKFMFKSA